ncbi:MAG TPA: universal stress protein [Burkholderiaceae bacterium]
MSYRVIDVFLSHGKDIGRVSGFAADLASGFGAHLCAQYVEYYPSMVYDGYGQAAELMAQFEESSRIAREKEKAAFASLAERNGLRFEWRVTRSSDLSDAIPIARTSDLVVMGQPNPDDGQSAIGIGLASYILLQSARPVLFLPYAMKPPQKFGTVAIAWDGSRQAARAIADAMPFLRGANEVWVMSVTKEKELERRLPDLDLGAYLAEHDVNVKLVENSKTGIDVGNWLLSTTADMNADLLVMGAYGHSRFGELVLGGATRTLLKAMTLPTIMSH